MFKYHQNTHINRPFNIVLISGTNKVVFMPENKTKFYLDTNRPIIMPE